VSLLARWRFAQGLRALGKTASPALAGYASADWPPPVTPARDAPYLALDFELDGLARGAHLLQAGWTPFEGRLVRLDRAEAHDIRSHARLDSKAVTIHGIGEERAVRGQPLGDVIAALIEASAGRIVIAHAAAIERRALGEAVSRLWGVRLPVRAICTLTLEKRLEPNLTGGEAYRLGPARARYGLPEYAAHDALSDAIAAAELFQAQLTRLPESTTLADLELR
jgi:DNA polymerase-3 subunit epsilon